MSGACTPTARPLAGDPAEARVAWTGAPALWAAFGLLLALRLWLTQAAGADLHVDEAQYWDWSRTLAWGYFSKPPMLPALIAVSTSVFGDGIAAVRLGAMLCWLLASVLLCWLGREIGEPRAGAWAAALLVTTPASGLLGLVATTDGPLVLCWAGAMWASWRLLAAETVPRMTHWGLLGLALGLGLLSKYTMLAALPTLAWLAWQLSRRQAVPVLLRGLALAGAVAVLLVLPNLLWNAAHGWISLRHTAAITVESDHRDPLWRYLVGQCLLVGPVGWWAAACAWRRRPGGSPAGDAAALTTARTFAIAWSLPLALIGLVQALHRGAEMNWTAPALLGLCLWLGLALARARMGGRALLLALAAGVLVNGAVASAAALGHWVRGGTAAEQRTGDVWARVRGWTEAFAILRPVVDRHPGVPLAANTRELLAQSRRAWRDGEPKVLSWQSGPVPRHHYDMVAGLGTAELQGPGRPAQVLLLSQAPVTAAEASPYRQATLLAEVPAGTGRIQLWLLSGGPAGEEPARLPGAVPLVLPPLAGMAASSAAGPLEARR